MSAGPEGNDWLDIAVIGAGPCGLAVGGAAKRIGRDAVLFDRGCVTQSLLGYPYYMSFFSTAEKLALEGVPFSIPESNPTRRQALAYYRAFVKHYALDINQHEDVHAVRRIDGGFELSTQRADGTSRSFRSRAVVMATGGFHEPNYLDCPGEDLAKVQHWYTEPYPYWDANVVVVGASNSAVEASLELWRNGARVTMVHFGDDIGKGVKPWVVPDIRNRLKNGEIDVRWGSRVASIEPGSVVLRSEDGGGETRIPNDFVLALTGWRSDPILLRELGVEIDAETGVPVHDRETMATPVPDLYIAGVLAAGNDANKIFIENGKFHGDLILREHARLHPLP